MHKCGLPVVGGAENRAQAVKAQILSSRRIVEEGVLKKKTTEREVVFSQEGAFTLLEDMRLFALAFTGKCRTKQSGIKAGSEGAAPGGYRLEKHPGVDASPRVCVSFLGNAKFVLEVPA